MKSTFVIALMTFVGGIFAGSAVYLFFTGKPGGSACVIGAVILLITATLASSSE